jgi:putative ABC transport system permease protein
MTDFRSDVRTALRQWRRRPALPLAVAVTLAAGLGAAIAVFAVTWTVAWRPLDVPEPARLLWIQAQSRDDAGQSSPGAFAAWQSDARTLDALTAVRPVVGVLADARGTDRLAGALVTESVFAVLGVQPSLGRAFTPTDDTPGAPRVVLLAHRTWQSRFAGDATAVGRAVSLNGTAATVVGVLPSTADALIPGADWWAPLALDASDRANTGPRYLDIVGRLAPGVSATAAQQELAAISTTLALTADDGSPLGVAATPFASHLTARYRTGLLLLFAGVAALVLIACANVAALLVTRAQDRGPELALRASLGASRGRLARQLVVEAGLLSLVASIGGLIAALWLTDLLRAVLPADVPRLADARVDGVAAVFALALGAAVTLATGLLPALHGARVDLQALLRIGATGGTGDDRLRRLFVMAQVALAVVLACAGALLVQSARALEAAPRGYDARGVVTTSLTLPVATYRDATAIASVVDRILQGVEAMPGMTSVSAASQVPFGGGSPGSDLALADETFSTGTDRQVRVRLVAPGYLRTLGVAMRDGREIGPTDSATSLPVVVVNHTLARRLTPAGSPVGRAVKFGVPVFNGVDGQRVWTVVGVAGDTWDRGPRQEVEPEVLLPLAQTPAEVFSWISRELQLAVRSAAPVATVASGIRRAVAAVDPALPLGPVRTIEERLATSFARERLIARLLAALGAAGVTLSVIGLVAIVHHEVRRRRRDIAIRLALGASSTGVVGELVREGTRLAVIGATAGVVASAATGGLFASLLFGVAPGDPITIAAVSLAIVTVAAGAAWLPARLAARVDPAEALRS